jgi:hypothetical protein
MNFAPSTQIMGYITSWFQFSTGQQDPFGAIRSGEIIQSRVEPLSTVISNATNLMPVDDSRPVNTEGTVLSSALAFTPLRANSRIQVSVSIPSVALSGGPTQWVGAIFRGSNTLCLSAGVVTLAAAEFAPFFLTVNTPATSTAPTSFSFRFGPATAGTARIAGSAAITPLFGPTPEYYIMAQEIAA